MRPETVPLPPAEPFELLRDEPIALSHPHTRALSELSTSTLMKVRALLLLLGPHRAIDLSGELPDTNFSSGRDASI